MGDKFGGILTNGLGADCKAMIIGPFRLRCTVVNIFGSGGSSVPPRWFQPLKADRDEEDEDLRRVIIEIRLTEFRTIRKEYIVTAERASKYVSIIGKIDRVLANISAKWKRSITGRFIRKLTVKDIKNKNEKD